VSIDVGRDHRRRKDRMCGLFFLVRRIHRRRSRKAGKYDAYYGQGQVVQQR